MRKEPSIKNNKTVLFCCVLDLPAFCFGIISDLQSVYKVSQRRIKLNQQTIVPVCLFSVIKEINVVFGLSPNFLHF